jgi:hypothetical protein
MSDTTTKVIIATIAISLVAGISTLSKREEKRKKEILDCMEIAATTGRRTPKLRDQLLKQCMEHKYRRNLI